MKRGAIERDGLTVHANVNAFGELVCVMHTSLHRLVTDDLTDAGLDLTNAFYS